ncbi:MAG: heavy metal translocating P-type ATPase [Phycisphaerales bacterium]|nr:heavy metal translocating P-type ATPase [Phycisphaerales bacterium]
MATHTLRMPAHCLEQPEHWQTCSQCLRQRLGQMPGIRKIDLQRTDTNDQAIVHLDYDPRLLSLNQLDAQVRHASLCLHPQRRQIVMGIDGMIAPRNEQQIESALAKLPGVVASASFASRSLRIEFDRTTCAMADIAMRLSQLGYRLRPLDPDEKDGLLISPIATSQTHAPGPTQSATSSRSWRMWLTDYHKLLMGLIGGVLCAIAFVIHRQAGPETARYAIITASFIIAGWYTAIDTFQVLRRLRFDIDVLMFAAAFGAATLGHFEEGAFLLVLFALGSAGEELAMGKARRAIEALAQLAPETATRLDPDGTQELVRVETLNKDDQVIIKPFERVPTDAAVVRGNSALDESPLTGESMPVEKTPGQNIYAGTINGQGLLVARVTKQASQSTLARIIRLVNEAQTTKSPTQVFTGKVEHYYVPLVLIATLGLALIPPLIGLTPRSIPESIWSGWFYQAMAFLTAASPCALAIGTPAAVLSGIARAARIGVLVKGGVHLENLGKVRVIAFDKTGTLTRGKPVVTDIIPLGKLDESTCLSLAAAVERSSSHPLASAIVNEAANRHLPVLNATQITQLPGLGVRGQVDGQTITAGRAEMLNDTPDHPENRNWPGIITPQLDRLGQEGKSTVLIAVDDQPIALIALADRPRDNAAATIARLRQIGLRRLIMLTGDKTAVARQIAADLDIDEFHAQLMPEDKLNLVSQLRQKYGEIAMVGDGVNDAPALAAAGVGIAMGGAGTDVALETADVALMADDLAKLPDAIGLSRFSRRIIAQNLIIALGVIAVLAPLAALGLAFLGVAVLFHEGSTIVVVLNSLRLLFYQPKG